MRVCMPAYAFYENDNRVMRYAQALVERGDEVEVFALRRRNQTPFERLNGVNLYRLQRRSRDERQGRVAYLYRLIKFLILSSLLLSVRHLARRYDVVHVHSVPDFEVFAAWLPRITGAKVILDIHDLVPELYIQKFGRGRQPLLYRLLLMVERLCIRFSHHVIVANHLWRETLLARSVSQEKCTAILNYPDMRIFGPRRKKRADDRFVLMYPGTLNHHQGVDIAVRAFSAIKQQIPSAQLHIYGEGPARRELLELIGELGLQDCVLVFDPVPIGEVAGLMAEADLGVVPKRANGFGNQAFSTKILEFMAVGVPVVCSDTEIDRYYFTDQLVRFFKSEDPQCLAEAVSSLWRRPEARQDLSRNSLDYVARNHWDLHKLEYLELLDRLTGHRALSH